MILAPMADLSVVEAARQIGVSADFLHRRIRRGELRASTATGIRTIRQRDLDAWLEAQRTVTGVRKQRRHEG